MSLRYGLETSIDLFEKLKRDSKLIDKEVTSDRFFNFIITAYHLREWVKKDKNVPEIAKQRLADDIQKNKYYLVCRDITNASKHFLLNYNNHHTANAKSTQGWGRGRWGKGKWGTLEEQIDIELLDGTMINVLEFKDIIVNLWELFLKKYGVLDIDSTPGSK